VCHNLIAIHYAKQHANCFSAFARLCLISRRVSSSIASMVDAVKRFNQLGFLKMAAVMT